MKHRAPRLLMILVAFAQFSCAAGNLEPLPTSMPVARAALEPQYRIFYDTLQDYGDWTLVEPYGYVFHPRISLGDWQPYTDGLWVPTDSFGWVWLSSEPFGWATYHYGQWINDSYQGWVWVPGVDWAPAWVGWRSNDTYVGWAPLAPNGTTSGAAYRYVTAGQLGATNLKQVALKAPQLGGAVTDTRDVVNVGVNEGVRYNRGPSLEWVARRGGPARAVHTEDVVSTRMLGAPQDSAESFGDLSRPVVPSPSAPPDSIAHVRRAAAQVASETRTIIKNDGRVDRLRLVRPFGVAASEPPQQVVPLPPPKPRAVKAAKPKPSAAPADSAR